MQKSFRLHLEYIFIFAFSDIYTSSVILRCDDQIHCNKYETSLFTL